MVTLARHPVEGLPSLLRAKESGRQILSTLFPSPIMVGPERDTDGKCVGWSFRADAYLGPLVGPLVRASQPGFHLCTVSVGEAWITPWADASSSQKFNN